jgi:hypothetical protein
MSRLRPFDRWVRWATLLALALATLAPGVSHALHHLRGDTMPWSQLCSATGAKRLVFEAPAGDDGSFARTHAFEQCTYCALHHDGPLPVARIATPALRADLAHAVPALSSLQAPRPLPAWRFALSRAPPRQA